MYYIVKGDAVVSDAVFYEMLSHVNSFSPSQKKSLLKALRASSFPRFSFKKHVFAKDLHLTESLIGIAGSADISLKQIKEERLVSK